MEYTQEFKDFVNACMRPDGRNLYVGIGNPNAKILFIGKEAAMREADDDYKNNAKCWGEHIYKNTCEDLDYLVHEKHPLRNGSGRNTWSKYQRLKDYIVENKEIQPFYVDFLKGVFTTDINDSPSKRTSDAIKVSLDARKKLFKDSAFIQNFPVVVLACSGYLKNDENVREIDDIFGVTYDGDEKGKKIYTSANWFYTHHSEDGRRLVIHTRQLSANVLNDMLQEMGEIIWKHLKNVGYMDDTRCFM